MNLLDENIIASQRELLRSWRISVRQIGYDFAEKGLQDDQIIPLLHSHRRTTFFTRDLGFYGRTLRHHRYCLVCLAVSKDEVAVFIRRLLGHRDFKTQAKRMGCVVHASHTGLRGWRVNARQEQILDWPNK